MRSPQLLKFKPALEQVQFCPGFNLKEVGSLIVCCPGQMFFKISKRMAGPTIYIIVESSQSQYIIRNKLANINLMISQAETDDCQEVNVGTERPFAWSNFQKVDPMLAVEFYFGNILLTADTQKQSTQNNKINFSLDSLNEFQTANLSVDGQKIRVFVSTFRDAKQALKVIEFSDQPSAQMVLEESKSSAKQAISIEVCSLCVSCIKEGREVVTISLYDILVKYVVTETATLLASSVGRLQVDNNEELDPIYPVLVKPKCLETVQHDHFARSISQPQFQFYLHTQTQIPGVHYVELLEFLVKETECKIELDHMLSLIDFGLSVQQQLNQRIIQVAPVFSSTNVSPSWRTVQVDQVNVQMLYIKQYRGSPLLVELSLFKQTVTQEQIIKQRQQRDSKQALGNRILEKLGNFGIKLSAISQAPIRLEALEMTNIYGHETDILNQLAAHYYQSLKGNIFRVAASSDLIGNPYNVVNSLGRGVKSAYYEPRDGFMRGPVQGGIGIIKGTGGMVAVTGATVVGSIGKVTNVINQGIIAVSMDRNYIHDKEVYDIKNKPQNVIQGVTQGVKGLGFSIFSGVTGVFTKPVEGAKAGGVAGFAAGFGKGLVGLVSKPVSGAVDLVSKTTQGVEAGVTGTIECQQNQRRIRQPRPFYGELNIVRAFSSLDADVYNILKQCKIMPFHKAFYLEPQSQSQCEILVMAKNFILLMDQDFKIRSQYDISSTKVQPNGIKLQISAEQYRFRDSKTAKEFECLLVQVKQQAAFKLNQ